ncbi:hypothetical protein [Hoeflea sp.]|uniref:hypothetical protein n=1 Tax=Hoeflea sp. TaxID=1940281 RepID=UPI003BAEA172
MMEGVASNLISNLIERVLLGKVNVNDEILATIRQFYFFDDGILGLISQLAENDYPDPELASKILVEFNDQEAKIREMLHDCTRKYRNNPDVSLDVIFQLESVAEGKKSIRRRIQDRVNYYLQTDDMINPEFLRNMIAEVKQLNEQIEALDQAIRLTSRK